MSSLVTVERLRDGVALLTLRRPEKLNALTWDMMRSFLSSLEDLGRDESVRVVVLTGEGRGFCAGLDIGQDDGVGSRADVFSAYRGQETVAQLALTVRNLPQPVIAAVNGPASGGGMAITLASDIRICAPQARFNVAFVRIGLSGADAGVSHLLPRIVGLGMASELMLTGRQVLADEALRIGLANRVVPAEALLDEAAALAGQIAQNSPFGVFMTKQVLHRNVDAGSLEQAIELENRTQILASRTEDMPEALAAFKEKRSPNFKGR
ncbi:enoyl-CoA hydratase/isomerase family protein [Conexibacter sp. W3-3-2]|uniref:enoyl-CoA hydratase/isomerase family protein n=1 Tax=Conexibacter sp. W3-3-2 TaxID=2675227 RepID=UPI0012B85386|nr:enoyl-CoA hydratase-related protein [Conexibacter sp. W3-3-2]MTD46394.1 enoyl-CoA hydratase/isomerase family protein [Conexibacter sp. W3-3-2]